MRTGEVIIKMDNGVTTTVSVKSKTVQGCLNEALNIIEHPTIQCNINADAGVSVGTIADVVKDMIAKDMEKRSYLRGR